MPAIRLACRRRCRRDLPVSEYYETPDAICGVMSENYGITRSGPGLHAYLYRQPSKILTNL